MTIDPTLICIGHRGAMGYEPENTLSSFERAIQMGCPWLELDVYVVDGEVVVIHDDTLERTTNGMGKLAAWSFTQLRKFDAGKGQQIPTLNEVIELVNHRAVINVELKGEGTGHGASELLADYCARGWSTDEFLLSSFVHKELARADPNFRRGALFGRRWRKDYFGVTEELAAWSINLDLDIVDAETVTEAHQRGLKVFVYTVNEPKDIKRMREIKVDGVFTNYPDRVLGS